MAHMASSFDICIRGAGIVGQTLALLLARNQLRVALVNRKPSFTEVNDVRAYALNQASKNLLEGVHCWPDNTHATSVNEMLVQGDGNGKINFRTSVDEKNHTLAWITDVPHLLTLLADAVQYQTYIEWVEEPQPAELTVICEGRNSMSCKELGINYEIRAYPEYAIATRVNCALPHQQIARQWFSDKDILAFLPLNGIKGQSVAVVWSTEQEKALTLQSMSATNFTEKLKEASDGVLGDLELCADRHVWPLQLTKAIRWCGVAHKESAKKNPMNWVLAGDAAHTVHPLAGQGLNLGLTDAQSLATHLQQRAYWRSVGDLSVLRTYERERKADVWSMAFVTDGLHQLFSRTEPPVQIIRNWGLNGLNQVTPMKNWLLRKAAGNTL
jgi:2-polyprenyl-6-methoxyphenol hydroxylase-like FAD-dependent oxidoreductase